MATQARSQINSLAESTDLAPVLSGRFGTGIEISKEFCLIFG